MEWSFRMDLIDFLVFKTPPTFPYHTTEHKGMWLLKPEFARRPSG